MSSNATSPISTSKRANPSTSRKPKHADGMNRKHGRLLVPSKRSIKNVEGDKNENWSAIRRDLTIPSTSVVVPRAVTCTRGKYYAMGVAQPIMLCNAHCMTTSIIPQWDLTDRLHKSMRTAGYTVTDMGSYYPDLCRRVGRVTSCGTATPPAATPAPTICGPCKKHSATRVSPPPNAIQQ